MTARTRGRASYDDLVKVPDNLVAELIEDELYTSPRPGGIHARFASAIGMDVGSAYDRGRGGPGGWWILFEPELHLLERNVLVPDLAGWRRERLPRIPTSHVFDVRPDWICEVLSPYTRQLDIRRKLPVYAANEIPNAWVVDPVAQTLEVFRLENARWSMLAVFGGDEIARAEPFDAIDIDLPSIWGVEQDTVNDR